MFRQISLLTTCVVCSFLIGCGPAQRSSEVIQTSTPWPLVQLPTVLPTETVEPTPLITTMVIWWPEPLLPLDNAEAAELRSEQLSAFQQSQGNVEVQIRMKKVAGLGGIMSTLRAAGPVAPGALPDLTSIRRQDLLAAVQAGLIYPLEEGIFAPILGDLYPSVLALGQVDGQLYGLPYMIEAQHMAFRGTSEASSRFSDILSSQITFALPAAQTSQINSILLTQYLDAGGTLPETGEDLVVNENALRSTLSFYERAVTEQLIDPSVLNYTTPLDYEAALLAGTIDAGVVSSTAYLRLQETEEQLRFGPVPTNSGAQVGEIDGWMWVVTTSSADRQALAARLLNWLLTATRQGEYSRAINMIPSQRTALQSWESSAYIDFVRELLESASLPLYDNEGGTVARALQNALVAVLSEERSAAEATIDLLERLDS